MTSISDSAGNRTDILYDPNLPGRISRQILTITDSSQFRTILTDIEYDFSGRISNTKIDSNIVTQYFYDGKDRIIKQIKPGGIEISYEYDNFDNVTRVTRCGSTVDYKYDRTKRLISITVHDVNNQITAFEYDKNSRIEKVIYPDASEENFKYNAVNCITRKKLRNNDYIYFGYDARGNLIWQSDDPNGPDGDVDNAGFLIEFEYNPANLITYAGKILKGEVVSQSEFEYNGFGKILKESTSIFGLQPVIIEYAYDQAGNIVSQNSGYSELNFSHDGLGRIKTIHCSGELIAEIEYLGSSISKINYPEPTVEYTAGFDSIGRIRRCRAIEEAGTIFDYVYAYDPASGRSHCVYNHIAGAPSEIYDYNCGQISKAQYADGLTEEFAYDAVGSRTEVLSKPGYLDTYYHNVLNQYTKIHTDFNFYGFVCDSNLYWDDNGRLNYDEFDSLSYEYDKSGNLICVKTGDQPIAEFVYDALGRRIRKITGDSDFIYYYDVLNRITAEYEITQTGVPELKAEYIYANGFSDVLARFLPEYAFDANGLIHFGRFCQTYLYSAGQQEFNSDFDYDSSGLVDLKDFAHFAGENVICFDSTDQSEKRWYYLKDAIGSVVAAIGGKYNKLSDREFFSYDVFGQPQQISSQGNKFMFAAMQYDPEIAKYYCVNRYYDARTGSFLSPDPLLFADGFNSYEYATNNPVMFTDRLGLKSSVIEEIQFLLGKGDIRAASRKLTEEIKKNCEKLAADCHSRRCIAGALNPSCRKADKCFDIHRDSLEYEKKLNSECAKAAAMAALAGTAQGLLNTVNGLQDIAVASLNSQLGIWSYSGALIGDKQLNGIGSPDWSKDLIVKESQTAHDISKFLGSQGLLTLITASGSAGQSAAAPAREGIYEFQASSGKTYVGQSSNIPRRVVEHIKSGKLLAKDAQTVKTTEVTGGRIAREIAEQARIDRLGGIKNLENSRNVIGPSRSHLMKK
ncbi:MAG: tRNA(Glu)-specific nuclease WapA precursor [Planctomycetes bacterium ADurb.Bin401]|nr:MAG: tRNA(Glu)-specific nuclease WapA precursor [Planctomycetes bacterium ADurb.Bin401]